MFFPVAVHCGVALAQLPWACCTVTAAVEPATGTAAAVWPWPAPAAPPPRRRAPAWAAAPATRAAPSLRRLRATTWSSTRPWKASTSVPSVWWLSGKQCRHRVATVSAKAASSNLSGELVGDVETCLNLEFHVLEQFKVNLNWIELCKVHYQWVLIELWKFIIH